MVSDPALLDTRQHPLHGAVANCVRVWDEGVRALALSLTTVSLLLDPETILIGGGLSEAGDRLLVPLEQRVSSMLSWRRPPALRRSLLGPRAGQIGAAILGFQAAGVQDPQSGWTTDDLTANAPLTLGPGARQELSLALLNG